MHCFHITGNVSAGWEAMTLLKSVYVILVLSYSVCAFSIIHSSFSFQGTQEILFPCNGNVKTYQALPDIYIICKSESSSTTCKMDG